MATAPTPPIAPSPQPQILTLGHPLLRQTAKPVTCPAAPAIQQLIDELLATVETAHGVGIAAPQLGYALRIVVVASRPNPRYPHAPLMVPTVLLNPQLVVLSEEQEAGWEGCLSVPGVRGQVPRARAVEVAFLDRFGTPQRCVWEGFVARIVQHEIDHLNGMVFLDRVTAATDLISEADYRTSDPPAVGTSQIY